MSKDLDPVIACTSFYTGGAGTVLVIWKSTRPSAFDIPFLFGTLDTPGYADLVGDRSGAGRLSRQLRASIVRFMRDGRPGDDLGADWPAYRVPERATLYVTADGPEVILDPWGEQREAWDNH